MPAVLWEPTSADGATGVAPQACVICGLLANSPGLCWLQLLVQRSGCKALDWFCQQQAAYECIVLLGWGLACSGITAAWPAKKRLRASAAQLCVSEWQLYVILCSVPTLPMLPPASGLRC